MIFPQHLITSLYSFYPHSLNIPFLYILHRLTLKILCDWCEQYLFYCRFMLEDCSTNLTVEVALGLSLFKASKSMTGSGMQCPLKWRAIMLNWFSMKSILHQAQPQGPWKPWTWITMCFLVATSASQEQSMEEAPKLPMVSGAAWTLFIWMGRSCLWLANQEPMHTLKNG